MLVHRSEIGLKSEFRTPMEALATCQYVQHSIVQFNVERSALPSSCDIVDVILGQEGMSGREIVRI